MQSPATTGTTVTDSGAAGVASSGGNTDADNNDVPQSPPAVEPKAFLKSKYRGVSLKGATGRWKAALKTKGCTYDLGTYDNENAAARAWDLAKICDRGMHTSRLNFPAHEYINEAPGLENMPLQNLALQLRGHCKAFKAKAPTTVYRGVRYNRTSEKWEASIRVGGRFISLGLYESDLKAAQAYDQAAIVRFMLGVGSSDVATTEPVLNFEADLYAMLLEEYEATEAERAAGPQVEVLQDKYVDAVKERCTEFLETSGQSVEAAVNADVMPPPSSRSVGEGGEGETAAATVSVHKTP